MRAYPPQAVANYFLELARREGRTITPMKLQKLVYFAHGWHLGLFDEPLVDEEAEAWDYGPVFPSLYRDLRKHGSGAIREPIKKRNLSTFLDVVPTIPEDDKAACALAERVWDTYKHLTAAQLSDITHQRGTPWYNRYVLEEGHRIRGAGIDHGDIKGYFKRLASQSAPRDESGSA